MRQKSGPPETPSERLVRDIRRATRKQYSAEEKIRIVLDGLRSELSIAELCRREGAKVIKHYHAPATPYERALTNPKLSQAIKRRLRETYRSIDPVALPALPPVSRGVKESIRMINPRDLVPRLLRIRSAGVEISVLVRTYLKAVTDMILGLARRLPGQLPASNDDAREQLYALSRDLRALRHTNSQLYEQLTGTGQELAAARAEIARMTEQLAGYRSSTGAAGVKVSAEGRRYLDREALVLLPRLMALLPVGERVTIVDAGAREVDKDMRWRPFPPERLRFFGFEADAAEAVRLNKQPQPRGTDCRFYPAGLWGSSGTVPFELNKAGGGSSFLPQNRTVTDRWKFENPSQTSLARDMFYPIRTESMKVVSLRDWARDEGVAEVDFLKINVQGGELEILNGAGSLLDSVLGIFLEVAFVESYQNRPMFSDIDVALRQAGFTFFDLLAHHYIGRAASPLAAQHLSIVDPKLGQLVTAWGQLIEGHALYFRDPMAGGAAATLPPLRLVKLAALLEAWGQIETAFELLDWLAKRADVKGTPLEAKIQELARAAVADYATHVLPGAPKPAAR